MPIAVSASGDDGPFTDMAVVPGDSYEFVWEEPLDSDNYVAIIDNSGPIGVRTCVLTGENKRQCMIAFTSKYDMVTITFVAVKKPPTGDTPKPSLSTKSPTSSTPEPSETAIEPSDGPSPTLTTASPAPSVSDSPTLPPATTTAPLPTPDMTMQTPSPAPSDLVEDVSVADDKVVMLPNGVLLTEEQADNLKVFKDYGTAVTTVFKNPFKILKALKHVGADMPPAKRKQAQEVVLSAIIVVKIIHNAAIMMVRK